MVDCLYRKEWVFRANVDRPLAWPRIKSGIGHQVPMTGRNCVSIRVYAEDARTAKGLAAGLIDSSRWLSWIINVYERPEYNYEVKE